MDGKQLRVRRVELGLNQTELGALLGVTQNTITRWESGDVAMRHPRIVWRALRDIEREAAALGVEPVELLRVKGE